MLYDPAVWGPHYWFFLHTIAHSYPLTPNAVTKRKYYDLLHNLPLFIPTSEVGDHFADLLDKYPVTPYLDNRDSLIRWLHFIHNKINVRLGKPEITLLDGIDAYMAAYKPKPVIIADRLRIHRQYLVYGLIVAMIVLIVFLYR